MAATLNAAAWLGIDKAGGIGQRFVDHVGPDGGWTEVDANGPTAGYTPGQMWAALDLAARRGVTDFGLRQTAATLSEAIAYTFPDGQDAGHRVLPSLVPYAGAIDAGLVSGDADYVRLKLDSDADARQFDWNEAVGAYEATGRDSTSGDPSATFGVLIDQTYALRLVQRRIDTAAADPNARRGTPRRSRTASPAPPALAADHLVRADGSTSQWGYFDGDTGAFVGGETAQGLADDSTWSRGQAWAILSFAEVAAKAGGDPDALSHDPALADDMALAATRTADYFLDHLPADLVPYWDFDAPAGPSTPRDSSAAAVAAYGLQVLSSLPAVSPADAARYSDAADAILESLATSYLRPADAPGLLAGGSGNVPDGVAVETPLVFGDHWFLRAIDLWERRNLD